MRWATRQGCHVDRAACAWLLRRFVDRDAIFDGLYEYRRRALLLGKDPA